MIKNLTRIYGFLFLTLFAFNSSAFGLGKNKAEQTSAQTTLHDATILNHSEAEPNYCSVSEFKKLEFSLEKKFKRDIKNSAYGLLRGRAFRLGNVVLIGAGIGMSDLDLLKSIATKYAPHSKSKGYCTWYLNTPKKVFPKEHIQSLKYDFNWKYLELNPMKQKENSDDVISKSFMDTLEDSFVGATRGPTFLSCAEEENYIALGCNGMAHRGPSVFGMLLSFSGCGVEHSLDIVNELWGQNGVENQTRSRIIEEAYNLGKAHGDLRKRLADVFTQVKKNSFFSSLETESVEDPESRHPAAANAALEKSKLISKNLAKEHLDLASKFEGATEVSIDQYLKTKDPAHLSEAKANQKNAENHYAIAKQHAQEAVQFKEELEGKKAVLKKTFLGTGTLEISERINDKLEKFNNGAPRFKLLALDQFRMVPAVNIESRELLDPRKVPTGKGNFTTLFIAWIRDFDYAKKKGLIFENLPVSQLPKNSYYNFLVTDKGVVRYGKSENSWEIGTKHWHLAQGENSKAAGELYIDSNGNVTYNLLSGTYTKQLSVSLQNVLDRSLNDFFVRQLPPNTTVSFSGEPLVPGDPAPTQQEIMEICSKGSLFLKAPAAAFRDRLCEILLKK